MEDAQKNKKYLYLESEAELMKPEAMREFIDYVDNKHVSKGFETDTLHEQKQYSDMPKQYKSDQQYMEMFIPSERFTKDELDYIYKIDYEPKGIARSDFDERANREQLVNKQISSEYQKQAEATINVPFEIREEIAKLPPITAGDYFVETMRDKRRKPTLENIVFKFNKKEALTEQEMATLRDHILYETNVRLRGVTFGGRLVDMVKDNIGENLKMTLTQAAIDAAIFAIPIPGSYTIKTGSKLVKGAVGVAKYLGGTLIKSGADHLINTFILDNIEGIESISEATRDKRINKQLEITEKGDLFFNRINQEEEDFMKYQSNVESFASALSERAIDPIFGAVGTALNKALPEPAKRTLATKIAGKTITTLFGEGGNITHPLAKLTTTTINGLVNENVENVFEEIVKYQLGALDLDATLSQVIKDSMGGGTLEGFALSQASIMISLGLTRGATNLVTNQKQRESFATKAIIKVLMEEKGYTKEQAESKIQNLTEGERDSIVGVRFEKETQEQKERYDARLGLLKEDIKKARIRDLGDSEEQAEKEAANAIKIYDSMYGNLAIEMGVSRWEVANRIQLQIKGTGEETTTNDNNTDEYAQAGYKNERTDAKEFADFVLEPKTEEQKERANKNESNKQGKTYQVFNGLTLDSFTVTHTNRKHGLIGDDWSNILNNANNIVDAKYNNNNLMLEIKTEEGNYGIVIQVNKNSAIIKTAFKRENENQWNEWWNKKKNKGFDNVRSHSYNANTTIDNIKDNNDNITDGKHPPLSSNPLNDYITQLRKDVKLNNKDDTVYNQYRAPTEEIRDDTLNYINSVQKLLIKQNDFDYEYYKEVNKIDSQYKEYEKINERLKAKPDDRMLKQALKVQKQKMEKLGLLDPELIERRLKPLENEKHSMVKWLGEQLMKNKGDYLKNFKNSVEILDDYVISHEAKLNLIDLLLKSIDSAFVGKGKELQFLRTGYIKEAKRFILGEGDKTNDNVDCFDIFQL